MIPGWTLPQLLVTPKQGDWYRVTAVPDGRFQNPMSTTDPAQKKALSKHFAPGYALSQILKWEPCIDENIEHLLRWIDTYAESRMPMDLDRFVTYTTFDNIGSVFFSQPFGFIKAVGLFLPWVTHCLMLNKMNALLTSLGSRYRGRLEEQRRVEQVCIRRGLLHRPFTSPREPSD